MLNGMNNIGFNIITYKKEYKEGLPPPIIWVRLNKN